VAGTGATGVVLANQVGATSCTWQPYVHKLVDRGYRVIAFDFAEDAGQSGTVTEDVTAAVAQLRKAGAAQVVLIGASRGGSASIAAAAAVDPPVLGAVSVSGPSIYDGANALAAAPKLAVPVLFLAGELDGSLPTDAQTLYDRTPGGQKKLVIIAGSRNHGQDFPLGVAQGATEANAAIDAFLGQYAKA
jgi:pimeloyl-ACP methyl ester carboxylesterase